ncbi:MAG: BtpA/SgcQ family protein [Candidatus Sumerlaeaceae bacterium]|nr:BtpA/SgcQ family protein [Candidatus Sumerlaeaceae bacterium]
MTQLDFSKKVMVGMVHLRALPGTPRSSLPVREICTIAASEARQLREAGFDALLVENMHDVPYLRREVGPEVTAAVTAAVCAVRHAVDCPVGVQILAGANREALAAALAGDAQFIRCEGFVFGHIADEGWLESDAGALLRMRKALRAEHIAIWADVKKKHSSHAVTADISLAEAVHAAEFFAAEAVVVTGRATGDTTPLADIQEAKRASRLPVIVGSGTTPDTLRDQWHAADGFIIGSWLKRDGHWANELDADRISSIMLVAHQLRTSGL